MKRKVAFYTLGCKLNFSESSTLARVFTDNGFERVDCTQPADIYVINTCSVTEQSDRKCRQAIRRFIRQSPDAIIAVTGCYAQLRADEIAQIEGVDLVVGADSKERLFEYANTIKEKGKARICSCGVNDTESFFQAFSSGDRTRSFLKVQDGCDYKCAYCTIPMARGKSRSPSVDSLLVEARKIAGAGTKEIILTGVNIGDFGHYGDKKLIDLLKALDEVQGIERFRISSIEPNLMTDEIIEFTAASAKFMPHFHIPLQSGSDRILRLMRRRYRRELLAEKMSAVRSKNPLTFFGIDVIVGFPGETDGDFDDTLHFLEQQQPAYLHVFPYSERPGTASAEMPDKVPNRLIAERAKALNDLCRRLHREFYVANLNRSEKALFESANRKGVMYGYTGNYIKIETEYDKNLCGKIVEVEMSGIADSGNMLANLSQN